MIKQRKKHALFNRFTPRLVRGKRVCLYCGAFLRSGNKHNFCCAKTCQSARQSIEASLPGARDIYVVSIKAVSAFGFDFTGKFTTGRTEKWCDRIIKNSVQFMGTV